MRVLSIFNKVSAGNIGLENFARVDHSRFEKHVLVVAQSLEEADHFVAGKYPDSGITVHGSETDRRISIRGSLQCVGRIKPDLIHVHHGKAAFHGAVAGFTGRYKLITTAHSTYDRYTLPQKFLFGSAYILSEAIACNSRNTLNHLPWYVRRSKREVLYNGVDFQSLDRNTDQDAKAPDRLRFGHLGRLVREKDVSTLIRGFHAFLQLPDAPDSELVLIGDGDRRQSLEALVAELGVRNQVRFLGHVDRDTAYRELGRFSVFVASSKWEGFCNAMVEAAAARKPVIASDILTLKEVMGEENAMFFPAGDYQQLAQHMLTLANDPSRRTKLGELASQHVRSKYSLESSVAAYEALYHRVNGSRTVGAR